MNGAASGLTSLPCVDSRMSDPRGHAPCGLWQRMRTTLDERKHPAGCPCSSHGPEGMHRKGFRRVLMRCRVACSTWNAPTDPLPCGTTVHQRRGTVPSGEGVRGGGACSTWNVLHEGNAFRRHGAHESLAVRWM